MRVTLLKLAAAIVSANVFTVPLCARSLMPPLEGLAPELRMFAGEKAVVTTMLRIRALRPHEDSAALGQRPQFEKCSSFEWTDWNARRAGIEHSVACGLWWYDCKWGSVPPRAAAFGMHTCRRALLPGSVSRVFALKAKRQGEMVQFRAQSFMKFLSGEHVVKFAESNSRFWRHLPLCNFYWPRHGAGQGYSIACGLFEYHCTSNAGGGWPECRRLPRMTAVYLR